MAGRISQNFRVAVPMPGTSINNSNATGDYVSILRSRRILAVLSCGAMAASKTTKLEFMQAKTAAAGSAEAIETYTATITANTKVKEVTVALASVGTGDTVTVTTYKDNVQVDTATFTKASADDGLEFSNAAGLEAAIIANVTGVTAADSSTNVTITALDDYTVTVAGGNVGGTVTVATTEAVVAVEIDENVVDVADGFLFVAPKVTSTANGYNTVTFFMEMKDRPEGQGNVGARYPTS